MDVANPSIEGPEKYCLCIERVNPPVVASSLCPYHAGPEVFLQWVTERNEERHRLFDEIERLKALVQAWRESAGVWFLQQPNYE